VALTEKQKRFVSEYLVDLNATQAAARAGYKDPNIGRQLITKNNVLDAIQKAIKDRENRTEITQDKVMEELGKVAFAKAADYTDSKLKYASKLRALELLGKHLGLFDGKGGQGQSTKNNLLDAIRDTEEIDTDDLPEVE